MAAGDSSPSVAAGAGATGGPEADGAMPLTVSLPPGAPVVLGASGVAGPIGPAGAPETSAAAPGGGLAAVVATVTCFGFADVVVSGRPRSATALPSSALRAR